MLLGESGADFSKNSTVISSCETKAISTFSVS